MKLPFAFAPSTMTSLNSHKMQKDRIHFFFYEKPEYPHGIKSFLDFAHYLALKVSEQFWAKIGQNIWMSPKKFLF